MDVAGHNAHLATGAGVDEAGAVGADEAGGAVLHIAVQGQHIGDGDAFGDGGDEGDAGVHCFGDGVGGEGRRDEDEGHIGGGLGDGFSYGVEDGDGVVKELAAASGGDAGDDSGAVGAAGAGVEAAFASGDALH